MNTDVSQLNLEKAAEYGEPSYAWRAGQARRLSLILEAAGNRASGRVLDNGCGVGVYLQRLAAVAGQAHGLEYDFERARRAAQTALPVVNASGECLPYASNSFDLVLSHEVLEHVSDDRRAAEELVRVLRPGGRAVVFVPNRWYPFETHGVYWRGAYHFGNIPLINYLPSGLRDRLAPHVRAYRAVSLVQLFSDIGVRIVDRRVLFGAYDNLIARWPRFGTALRWLLHRLEATPLQVLGLSHFWVLEKEAGSSG